jgi:hypothetical protein
MSVWGLVCIVNFKILCVYSNRQMVLLNKSTDRAGKRKLREKIAERSSKEQFYMVDFNQYE